MTENPESTLDLVWGAENIAQMIRVRPRQAYHMLESGMLPAKKVGRRWVADREKLRAFFVEEAA